MVNKPHPPRQNNKLNKNSIAANANGEDTSYIVFSNDKGKKSAQCAPRDNGRAMDKAKQANNSDTATAPTEKRTDTRTLIAGSSWTGKLPMTLFNEHCQKQRWEKPEYTVRQKGQGFTGAVLLRQKNPKTQEITSLPPILPPKEYEDKSIQPSAIEARHFAATYALFRVSNAKNIHMMLPPQYRELWKGDFQDLKRTAIAQGQAYLYDANPFMAKRQNEDAKAAKEKAKAAAIKQQEEDKKQQVTGLDGQIQSKHILKGWQRAPKVEMGIEVRRQVETLIRDHCTWNTHGRRIRPSEASKIVETLSKIGFRRSHVEEAIEICKDAEECLEWLLVHVPEDDLPKWTLPENYLAGVSLASGDLGREAKLKRLAASGYARDLCIQFLERSGGDERQAAAMLQDALVEAGESSTVAALTTATSRDWDEEQTTLEAIFGDRIKQKAGSCTVSLDARTAAGNAIAVSAYSPGVDYPKVVPVMTIDAELPAYIKLSVLKQCIVYARENFLGEQMIFHIVDWLEHNITDIMDRPGKLGGIASAASISANKGSNSGTTSNSYRKRPNPISWALNTPTSLRLLDQWEAKQKMPAQVRMLQTRRRLPAWSRQDDIISSVNNHQVTIISGETGSGKSTQSVQFILDDLIKRRLGEHVNIICTQPRRISALGLADRVAEERCGRVGDEIGYAIRGEAKYMSGTTKICFVTTGVLLRRLQTSGGSPDDVVGSLADVSHVVIDEVHERSLDTDFLLVLLFDVLKKRKDLKLVLMSATLDASLFKAYFQNALSVDTVEIEGRSYPVEEIYFDELLPRPGFTPIIDDNDAIDDSALFKDFTNQGATSAHTTNEHFSKEANNTPGTRIDYELIAHVVSHIDEELAHANGGILIFLPGVAEIDQALRTLRDIPGLFLLPLHASLPTSEQKLVFRQSPPGKRKVIVATNIAETSITIDDVIAVIDSGRVKQTTFDPTNNMVRLAEVWASKAACKQRCGRAGRVRAGKCYKLFTRSAERHMAERPDPEILRVPLEQLCLSVKAMGVHDVSGFLAAAITPPKSLAVEGALSMLARIGALSDNEVTALGWHLSRIPADLRCAKLMVFGAAFGCLDSTVTLAAILTVKSPFISPQSKRAESKKARAGFSNGYGDLICDLRAYQEFSARRQAEPSHLVKKWCNEHFLSFQTLMDIGSNRRQYITSLREAGFITGANDVSAFDVNNMDRFECEDSLLCALIAGAFQPQMVRIEFPDKKFAASSSGAVELDLEARTIKYFNQENGRVFVHPSSTLFDAQVFPGNSVFMSYFNKMATSKIFIRDLTPFNVFSLLMFSGPIEIDSQGRGLLVDGWVRVRGWARIGVLVSRLRMMLDALMMEKIKDPSMDMSRSSISQVVKRLVEFNGLDR